MPLTLVSEPLDQSSSHWSQDFFQGFGETCALKQKSPDPVVETGEVCRKAASFAWCAVWPAL